MSKWIWIVGLMALVAPQANAQSPKVGAKQTAKQRQVLMVRVVHDHCAASWSQKERRKECVDKQLAASSEVGKLFATYRPGSEERFLVVDCLERWIRPEEKHVDYRLALSCAEFEIEKHMSRQ